MARIAGINIPAKKKVFISLTYIYGIGLYNSHNILKKARISPDLRVGKLSDNQIRTLNEIVKSYEVEGNLRAKVSINIKNQIDMKSYVGLRHIKRLPKNGQRTRTNARTRRGKSIAIAGKPKVTK